MSSNDLPDRELSPTELRQLIESNARAIRANSESIAEGFRAVQSDLQHLARIMEQYFAFQGRTNNSMQDGLEDHERRISRLEQSEGG